MEERKKALILGDGPTYHSVAHHNFRSFDGLLVVAHYYRHSPDVIVSIDPRSFNEKERLGVGKCRVVIAMSNWAQRLGLRQKVPLAYQRKVEWDWIDEPKLTSGIFGIMWAAKQGYKEIYTAGVDLTPGYHRSFDLYRHQLLSKVFSDLSKKDVVVYKRSSASSLPVQIKEPPLLASPQKWTAAAVQLPSSAHRISGNAFGRAAPWEKRRPQEEGGEATTTVVVYRRNRRRPFQR